MCVSFWSRISWPKEAIDNKHGLRCRMMLRMDSNVNRDGAERTFLVEALCLVCPGSQTNDEGITNVSHSVLCSATCVSKWINSDEYMSMLRYHLWVFFSIAKAVPAPFVSCVSAQNGVHILMETGNLARSPDGHRSQNRDESNGQQCHWDRNCYVEVETNGDICGGLPW